MVKTEIRECIKWLLTTGKKQWKIINSQAQRVVMVTYRRWSFTRGSNCKALTRENCGVSDWQPLMEGGRLWEVVAHGGSIVQWNPTLQPPWPYGHLVVTATFFGCLAKTAIHNSCKKTLVNTTNFFGPLVTILTGFHCISFPNMNLIMGTSWF